MKSVICIHKVSNYEIQLLVTHFRISDPRKLKSKFEVKEKEKRIVSNIALSLFTHTYGVVAIPAVEFSREGFKIRKVFGEKSTVVK